MKKSEFNKILKNYIDRESELIKEHEEVKAILKPLEGKPINGQVLNKKRLGKFRFTQSAGLYHIQGKYSHLIGYVNSENIISIQKTEYSRGFEYFDQCNGRAALERIEQIQNMDREKAFSIFSKIDKHFNAMVDLFGEIKSNKLDSYYFPVFYDVLNSIYKAKSNNDIQLTRFQYIERK